LGVLAQLKRLQVQPALSLGLVLEFDLQGYLVFLLRVCLVELLEELDDEGVLSLEDELLDADVEGQVQRVQVQPGSEQQYHIRFQLVDLTAREPSFLTEASALEGWWLVLRRRCCRRAAMRWPLERESRRGGGSSTWSCGLS